VGLLDGGVFLGLLLGILNYIKFKWLILLGLLFFV